ncbi:hypothetical protein [Polyangium sp. 15x6]|uniref:hypothetical protein n=1 Tax=Polyangium sp. 15x6 TaxID=3042687 RepID=UPI00249A9830|nr:hypothetical protein [Polyangium sp. 15x6]MDI3286829.1 hypothetical protein [Polyangium sp. 15x6]
MRVLASALCAATFTMLLSPAPALAEPYEVYARYEPHPNAGGNAITITLADGEMIPRSSLSHKLVGLYFRIKKDDISKVSLSTLRNFSYALKCSSPSCGGPASPLRVKIEGVELGKGTPDDKLLIAAGKLPGNDVVDYLSLEVRSKFLASYLCAQEQEIRKDGTEIKDPMQSICPQIKMNAADAGAPDKCDASKATRDQLNAIGLLSSGLGTTKSPVFYSFCGKISALIDWQKAAGTGPAGESTSDRDARAKAYRTRQKHELSMLLVDRIRSNEHIDNIEVKADAEDQPENIYVWADHPFSVLREPKTQFALKEVDGSEARWLADSTNVHQGSEIRLVPTEKSVCAHTARSCDELVHKYLTVTIEGTDKDGKHVNRAVSLTDASDGWKLDMSLRDFLYKEVTIKLWYNIGGERFEIRRDSVVVEDFGLVTSFPVVSEIVSLAQKGGANELNPKAPEFKSSIPISWAYNMSAAESRHVAITLPWMIGYNFRGARRLADMIKVFPHMSLILPLSADANGGTSSKPKQDGAQLAFGVGASFVNTFSVAWGMTTDTGANYALLGISVPDLVKIIH